MIPPTHERGAALLTVLMLVAVIATVSAGVLDRLTVATRLAGNAGVAAQQRQWLGFAENLAAVRLEDLAAANPAQTAAGTWLNVRREVRLPDGGRLTAMISDGGNCFNLNSLVRRGENGSTVADPAMVTQLAGLLVLLGVDAGRAQGIAASSADWIDTDEVPLPGGAERSSYPAQRWGPSDSLMVDTAEFGSVKGVSADLFTLVRPFICTLPVAAPSTLNANTLLPEQAALLAMLAPDKLGILQARAAISARPAAGFTSSVDFWNSPALANLNLQAAATEQVRVSSKWFVLDAEVTGAGQDRRSWSLIDLSGDRARVVNRRYGAAS